MPERPPDDPDTASALARRRGLGGEVYEPAEDSYLLLGVCLAEIQADERVLDVGTGTGVLAARIRAETGATVAAVDVNPHACRRAADRGVSVFRGDLVSAVADASVDALVCNPPYLPTAPKEQREDWLSRAVSGGPSGRAVVEALLADAARVLRPEGRVYLLASSLMDVAAVRATAETHGFTARELDRDDSFPFEVLSVLRLDRADAPA